ncbi:molybdopterin cofactor-binding domain-containing protein [Streptomyces sp. 2A115]|uniref:molybdopterin cofactor-binding domain-containing protein n=1 Tax=Streptomyces sp. 2A115 TaxID=3457439 RepID=UPI003FD5A1B3
MGQGTSGAQFCQVRIDPATGEIRIARSLGLFDVGKFINPKTAASQLRGAVVMGIGMDVSDKPSSTRAPDAS